MTITVESDLPLLKALNKSYKSFNNLLLLNLQVINKFLNKSITQEKDASWSSLLLSGVAA